MPLRVPWKPSDVGKGIGVLIACLAILVLVYGAVSSSLDPEVRIMPIVGVTGLVMVFVAWTMGPRRHRASLTTLGLNRPREPTLHLVGLPFLVVGASAVFALIYAGVISLLDRDILQPESVPDDVILGGPAVIGSFALVAIWGPLAEEIFFRGFVLSGLASRWGFLPAAIASSLLFALAHIDPRVMVPIFVIGLFLAWLYHKTGSIWSSFAAHGSWNALALSISVWG